MQQLVGKENEIRKNLELKPNYVIILYRALDTGGGMGAPFTPPFSGAKFFLYIKWENKIFTCE